MFYGMFFVLNCFLRQVNRKFFVEMDVGRQAFRKRETYQKAEKFVNPSHCLSSPHIIKVRSPAYARDFFPTEIFFYLCACFKCQVFI